MMRIVLLAACTLATASAWAEDFKIIAGPYLNFPTETSMVIRWETNLPASSEAGAGIAAAKIDWKAGTSVENYHEVVVEGLEPDGKYFYQTRSTTPDGQTVTSEVYTFQTAVSGDAPFSFAVFGDTQANPDVVATLAAHAFSQRPHFTLLAGDLVTSGDDKSHWLDHFFNNMHPLNSRVPLIPCLGNHERDDQHYYKYFSLPAPEYYYRIPYGNLELFIVDSERPLVRGSEQYEWLDAALGSSKATWKIVCLHKPAFSSDENDFGDTLEVRNAGGDISMRFSVELYEKHGVDIVWCGHIHSYERTHPLNAGEPFIGRGVVYMITGGGGGGLEKAAPWRSPFSAKVYSGHHYCMVSIHGPKLRIEAYDLEGRLFDLYEMAK
jgi:predicted phosphodiesterase